MPRKSKPKIAAPIAGDPGQPTKQGREVRFIYPDGRKWDSVALVMLEDGTLDYCQGYDFTYGWLVWKYQGYDTIDGKPVYKIFGQGTRSQLGV